MQYIWGMIFTVCRAVRLTVIVEIGSLLCRCDLNSEAERAKKRDDLETVRNGIVTLLMLAELGKDVW
jgi:hypothetical protein